MLYNLRESHIAWNLFLGLIPVVLSFIIAFLWKRFPALRGQWWLWGALGLLWLGFLPNACYLITEWRHYIDLITENPEQVRAAAYNKDATLQFLGLTTFYVVYSVLGLVAFSASIWPVAEITRPPIWMRAIFFLLCAIGVYIGLIKRLNTWDLWHDPAWVFSSALETVTHPLLAMLTIGFAGALWLNYWVFEVFVDGLIVRARRARYLRAQTVQHS